MLIVTAGNLTENLARHDGTADYSVWVGVNAHCIWHGTVKGHVRKEGTAKLLRLIADRMEAELRSEARLRGI